MVGLGILDYGGCNQKEWTDLFNACIHSSSFECLCQRTSFLSSSFNQEANPATLKKKSIQLSTQPDQNWG